MELGECSNLFDWPESERLKKVLYVEAPKFEHFYTMPGIKTTTVMEDPIANTAEQMLNKTVLRPIVSPDKEGLKQLIVAGHLRAAVNLTEKILTDLGQGSGMAGQPSKNTLQSFEIWACRFQLLIALKCYSLLNDELSPFEELDAPDLYMQYYPQIYESRKGSLIPFSLRLVHAESLRFTPFPWAAIQRIHVLEENVLRVIDTEKEQGFPLENLKIWELRLVAVQKLRARTLYFLKEYNLSMLLYNRICAKEEKEEKKVLLKLLLMRIATVIGDEKSVSRFLKEIPLTLSAERDVHLHRCLKSVFFGQYNKALDLVKSTALQSEDRKLWNNAAVCMLYTGRVNEALKIFEKFFDVPNEPLLLNTVSIYELSGGDIKQKKLKIFEETLAKLPDMFDPIVLKLSS